MRKLNLKRIEVREMVRKKVVRSGTGGAVWVPVKWLGKEVIVILPEEGEKDEKNI